jgi:hypothetical protein
MFISIFQTLRAISNNAAVKLIAKEICRVVAKYVGYTKFRQKI